MAAERERSIDINRRQFLRGVIAASAGTTLVGAGVVDSYIAGRKRVKQEDEAKREVLEQGIIPTNNLEAFNQAVRQSVNEKRSKEGPSVLRGFLDLGGATIGMVTAGRGLVVMAGSRDQRK